MKADILFVQETWLSNINEDDLQDIPNDFIVYSQKKKKEAGKRGRVGGTSAWFVREKYGEHVKVKFISNRVSLLTLKIKNLTYSILGCYLSSDNSIRKYQEELTMVSVEIAKLVEKGHEKIMVLGDFNGDIRRNNAKDIALQEFFESNDIVPINILNRQRNTNTFLSWQQNYSYLDYIGIRRPWDKNKREFTLEWREIDRVNDVLSEKECEAMIKCSTWEATNHSDHRPIATTLNVDNAIATVKLKEVKYKRIQWLNKKHQEKYNDNFEKMLAKGDLTKRLHYIESGNDADLKVIAVEKWLNDFMELLVTGHGKGPG